MSRAGSGRDPADLYLDLLKKVLTRSIFPTLQSAPIPPKGSLQALVRRPLYRYLESRGLRLVRETTLQDRLQGHDWPADAETMIGVERLDNLHRCIRRVIEDEVPGDLMEAGVWRGGASIFMRAALAAYEDPERFVWAADSFAGLPPPSSDFPADTGDQHSRQEVLSVGLSEVKANFARYGLLDDRVRFIEGWFDETLPSTPIDALAVLRVDADMYGSTHTVLANMYPKVSDGGFVIIDDYLGIESCRRAVDDFRRHDEIHDELIRIDSQGVYWRKSRA